MTEPPCCCRVHSLPAKEGSPATNPWGTDLARRLGSQSHLNERKNWISTSGFNIRATVVLCITFSYKWNHYWLLIPCTCGLSTLIQLKHLNSNTLAVLELLVFFIWHLYINSTQLWKCFIGVCLQSQNSIRKFKINSVIMSCFHICTVALNCSQQVRMEIFNTDGSNICWF